jgi:hypothetical protein
MNRHSGIYRQGDVLLKKVNRKPRRKMETVAKIDGKIVLAHGEATGHAHVIVDEGDSILSQDASKRLWLEIFGPATLRHGDLKTLQDGDHAEIALGKGVYEVVRQQEYSPKDNMGVRNVED